MTGLDVVGGAGFTVAGEVVDVARVWNVVEGGAVIGSVVDVGVLDDELDGATLAGGTVGASVESARPGKGAALLFASVGAR